MSTDDAHQISPGQSAAVLRAAPPWVAFVGSVLPFQGVMVIRLVNPGRRSAEYRCALPWAILLRPRWGKILIATSMLNLLMTSRMRSIVAIVCLAVGVGLIVLSFTAHHDVIGWYARSGLLLLIVGAILLRSALRRPQREFNVDWYDATNEYHTRTFPQEAGLSSLPMDWQRELAALWRLQADVNNGGYLQFLGNWGGESYVYASQGLRKMGANKTADIIDRCQALVDEHCPFEDRSREAMRRLLPNAVIDLNGTLIKDAGSALPNDAVEEILQLSYEFMNYPDDLSQLGLEYYHSYIEEERKSREPL